MLSDLAAILMPIAVAGLLGLSVYHLYRFGLRRQLPSLVAATTPLLLLWHVTDGAGAPFVLVVVAFVVVAGVVIYWHESARQFPWR